MMIDNSIANNTLPLLRRTRYTVTRGQLKVIELSELEATRLFKDMSE
jgi:homospermidine synthase